MTKGPQDYDKFLVIGCDGSVLSTEKSLPIATEVAEAKGACAVLKIQRLCDTSQEEIVALLSGEVVEEEDFEEEFEE